MFLDPTYRHALKNKRVYKVKGSNCTMRLFSKKGLMTLSRARFSDWDWKNTDDYWPLEYHKDSLFKESIPHLRNAFFFRPVFYAN